MEQVHRECGGNPRPPGAKAVSQLNASINAHRGILYALLAYGAWGLFPIYWKGFGSVPAVEVISHRLIWSLVFLVILAACVYGG